MNEKSKEFARALGAQLVAARGIRSQAKFARELGIGIGTLGAYERGERVPGADVLAEVVRLTGADPAELLGVVQAPSLSLAPNAAPALGRLRLTFHVELPPALAALLTQRGSGEER